MGGEVVVFAVLEDKKTAGPEQPVTEQQVGNQRQLLQRVGRVGKDEVELLPARLDEAEGVGPQGQRLGVGHVQPVYAVADETVVVAVELYADHAVAAP